MTIVTSLNSSWLQLLFSSTTAPASLGSQPTSFTCKVSNREPSVVCCSRSLLYSLSPIQKGRLFTFKNPYNWLKFTRISRKKNPFLKILITSANSLLLKKVATTGSQDQSENNVKGHDSTYNTFPQFSKQNKKDNCLIEVKLQVSIWKKK